jgi:hypothetical protein
MKRTLLEMTQSILSDMDSEGVNSISDTVEATQIASVIEDTFFNIIAARDIPEHKQLIKLTSLSNSAKPSHFTYPANTRKLELVQYNIGTTTPNYKTIVYVDPMTFISRMDESSSNVVVVTDVKGGTPLYIRNDRMPSYYTSFDDENIVMDSFDISVDVILQTSKTRAYGYIYPTFNQTDDFTPDVDDTMLPYLLAEAKSVCFSLFKSGSDPKIEQSARRLKSFVQNDMYKTKTANKRPNYGRT